MGIYTTIQKFGFLMVFKEASYSHKDWIYLIKNTAVFYLNIF